MKGGKKAKPGRIFMMAKRQINLFIPIFLPKQLTTDQLCIQRHQKLAKARKILGV